MLETRADFARRMATVMGREVNRSTVTRWADAGRIVMQGEQVDVEASLAQLEATGGARTDVSDRHAQEAKQKPAAGDSGPAPSAQDISMNKARHVRAVSEARIKHAQADQEEMSRDKMSGSLVAREEIEYVLRDFGASLGSLLENMADRLAPLVYPLTSLEDTHAAISEMATDIQQEMADTMQRRSIHHGAQSNE